METEFGITQFLGDRTEIVKCVVKELYSDFQVREILEKEQGPLPIKTVEELPPEETKPVVTEPDDSVEFVPQLQDASVQSDLYHLFNRNVTSVEIPVANLTKEERKAIHNNIRDRFRGKLKTEFQNSCIIKVSFSQNHLNSFRRQIPPYTLFTLLKENKETNYAIDIIGRFLGIRGNNVIKCCGMKDRRAVTVQRMAAVRVAKERLMGLNKRLRGMLIYDCEYSETCLDLGRHWGNRFNVILRAVAESQIPVLQSRAEELETLGFINYFGTQRFGSVGNTTAEIGRLILRRQWDAAVHTIFQTSAQFDGIVGNAVKVYLKEDSASAALKLLKGSSVYASIEGKLLKALSEGLDSYQSILTLPYQMCSFYVHAYQSLLWNKIVSRRIAEHELNTVPEDIGVDGELLKEGSSIFDVYVPLPTGKDEQVYRDFLLSDEIPPDAFRNMHKKFSLSRTLRQMIIKPVDVETQVLRYNSKDQTQFLPSLSKEVELPDENGDAFALRIAFSLPRGCYATMALRQLTAFDVGKASMKALSMETKAQHAENNTQAISEDDSATPTAILADDEGDNDNGDDDDDDEPPAKRPRSYKVLLDLHDDYDS